MTTPIMKWYESMTSFSLEMSAITASWMSDMMNIGSGFWHANMPTANPEQAYHSFYKKIISLSESLIKNIYLHPEERQSLPETFIRDKRFQSTEWNDKGFYEYLYKTYQLTCQYLLHINQLIDISKKDKDKLSFFMKHYLSALHPANFAITNPEYMRTTVLENGSNLMRGLSALAEDMKKKYITQTDEKAFEIGRDIASTPGFVVFKNTLIELIQFTPTTDHQYENAVLFIPPCINKYYILDISQEESFARFILSHQFPTYMVSWKNIGPDLSHIRWEDYINCLIEVLDFIQKRQKNKTHIISYCIGSIIALTATSIFNNKKYVSTITTMAATVDYSKQPDMVYFLPPPEKIMKGKEEKGIVFGEDLRAMYSLLRPEDLIWPYVTNNYLLGQTPHAFDILYWSNDAVNLPQPMFYFYLNHTFIRNELKEKNVVPIFNTTIDFSKMDIPIYFFVSEKDHITPWQSGFDSLASLPSIECFVLGSSGHTRGVIPSSKSKKNYYLYSYQDEIKQFNNAQEWLQNKSKTEGSWWDHLIQWIKKHTEQKKIVPSKSPEKLGTVIEKSPGSYVKEPTASK